MNTYVLDVVQKYKRKGILIDTNVALLYIIGSINTALIGDFKLTAKFRIGEFELIEAFIEFFPNRFTTPHVLTEISNLLPSRDELSAGLLSFIENSDEVFVKGTELSVTRPFLKLGLADAAIIEAAHRDVLVVTDDGPLAGYLRGEGFDSLTTEEIIAF